MRTNIKGGRGTSRVREMREIPEAKVFEEKRKILAMGYIAASRTYFGKLLAEGKAGSAALD